MNSEVQDQDEDENQDQDTDVKFVDEIVQKPTGAQHKANIQKGKKMSLEVKKLQHFRVIDCKLVDHKLNPRLPKFRALEHLVLTLYFLQYQLPLYSINFHYYQASCSLSVCSYTPKRIAASP